MVIEDACARGVASFLNLGDALYGPLDPMGTFKILSGLDITSVMGNEDRILVDPPPGYSNAETLRYTTGRLDKAALAWLGGLPACARPREDVVMFHGTPRSDEEYLLRRVSGGRLVPRTDGGVAELIGEETAGLVLCAHDHSPAVRRIGDALVVDPGSVGLQAYTDSDAPGHSTGTGDPAARYAIVERGPEGWSAELIEVEYDTAPAERAAETNGRDDWAVWLRTGNA